MSEDNFYIKENLVVGCQSTKNNPVRQIKLMTQGGTKRSSFNRTLSQDNSFRTVSGQASLLHPKLIDQKSLINQQKQHYNQLLQQNNQDHLINNYIIKIKKNSNLLEKKPLDSTLDHQLIEHKINTFVQDKQDSRQQKFHEYIQLQDKLNMLENKIKHVKSKFFLNNSNLYDINKTQSQAQECVQPLSYLSTSTTNNPPLTLHHHPIHPIHPPQQHFFNSKPKPHPYFQELKSQMLKHNRQTSSNHNLRLRNEHQQKMLVTPNQNKVMQSQSPTWQSERFSMEQPKMNPKPSSLQEHQSEQSPSLKEVPYKDSSKCQKSSSFQVLQKANDKNDDDSLLDNLQASFKNLSLQFMTDKKIQEGKSGSPAQKSEKREQENMSEALNNAMTINKKHQRNNGNMKMKSLVTQVRRQQLPIYGCCEKSEKSESQSQYQLKDDWYYLDEVSRVKDSHNQDYTLQLAREQIAQNMHSIAFTKGFQHIFDNKHKEVLIQLEQKANHQNKYTLVLDLDETLIHCNQTLEQTADAIININLQQGEVMQAGINIRPYAKEFLQEMSYYYEIIVFTASHGCYASKVIELLDPHQQYIQHSLFREHCILTQEGIYVKDLRIFNNRSLDKIILVDNAAYSFAFQLDNGIPIIPFYDSKQDNQLLSLSKFLRQIHNKTNITSFLKEYFMFNQYQNYTNPFTLIDKLYTNKNKEVIDIKSFNNKNQFKL